MPLNSVCGFFYRLNTRMSCPEVPLSEKFIKDFNGGSFVDLLKGLSDIQGFYCFQIKFAKLNFFKTLFLPFAKIVVVFTVANLPRRQAGSVGREPPQPLCVRRHSFPKPCPAGPLEEEAQAVVRGGLRRGLSAHPAFHDRPDTLRETAFMKEALSPPVAGEVLDIACGYGRHAIEFGQRGIPGGDGARFVFATSHPCRRRSPASGTVGQQDG